jgi:hypothetical protein
MTDFAPANRYVACARQTLGRTKYTRSGKGPCDRLAFHRESSRPQLTRNSGLFCYRINRAAHAREMRADLRKAEGSYGSLHQQISSIPAVSRLS